MPHFMDKSVYNRTIFKQIREDKIENFSRRRKPWLRLLSQYIPILEINQHIYAPD